MAKYIYFILLVVLIAGCGVQSRINKMKGHTVSSMLQELGKPTTIIPRASDSVYVYEIKKELASTEINKGALTLDPMVTPTVEKTDKYIFVVKSGYVVETRHEKTYIRKQ